MAGSVLSDPLIMACMIMLQQRFITRLSGFLSGPKVTKGIQGRWLSYLAAMDKGLGAAVRAIACKSCT